MTNEQHLYFEMTPKDISCALKAYTFWEDSKNETPIDFISRKRNVDLAYLLNEVIEKELTETEQEILRMFYFENITISGIAKKLCLHRSTIARRIECINDKIHDNLKYAIKYEFDQRDDYIVPVAVSEALALCAIKSSKPHNVGGRLLKLRKLSALSCCKLSNCTKISEKRLKELENGKATIRIDEAVCLSAFFNVSTDYILTGKEYAN